MNHMMHWIGRTGATAALVLSSFTLMGFAMRPLKQLVDVSEVVKGQGPLTAGTWSVVADPSRAFTFRPPVVISGDASANWPGRARAENREPDLWRHEF